MILGGALATLLLTTTAISTRQAIQASHDTQHTHDQTTLATASIGPTSLMSRLQNERNAAAIYMLGQEDQFTLQHEDPVEAARITDEAVATFRAEVERQGDAVVDAYSPAFEAMEGLEDLRAEAAATPEASRTLVNIDATAANFDAYSEIRAAMVDANRRVALSLDDPQLRQGVQLVELNGLQANLVAVLVRDLLLAQVGGTDPNGLDTPEEISGVARRLSEVRHNWDLMVSGGSGRYGPLVEELLAAEEVQRFPEVVEESLQTGEVNVADVITYSFGDDPETLAYTVFAERVDHIVRERSRGLEAAVARRQRLSSVLAGAAAALALVVIFTLVVVTRRRRERLQRETAAPTHDEVQIARVS